MTFTKSTKIIGTTVLALGLISGAAYAGDKKDCADKNHTAMQKTQMSTPTMVLSASTEKAGYPAPAKAETKIYNFDEALAMCQKYGAADLQACIDKKTGVTAKPKS